MRLRSLFSLFVFVTILAAQTTLAAAESHKIKVGIMATSAMIPLYYAQENGWYKEAGVGHFRERLAKQAHIHDSRLTSQRRTIL